MLIQIVAFGLVRTLKKMSTLNLSRVLLVISDLVFLINKKTFNMLMLALASPYLSSNLFIHANKSVDSQAHYVSLKSL